MHPASATVRDNREQRIGPGQCRRQGDSAGTFGEFNSHVNDFGISLDQLMAMALGVRRPAKCVRFA